MEVKQDEKETSRTHLLNLMNNGLIKVREFEGTFDLFIPLQDTFLSLDLEESKIFKHIFFGEDFEFSPKKEVQFLKEFQNEIQR